MSGKADTGEEILFSQTSVIPGSPVVLIAEQKFQRQGVKIVKKDYDKLEFSRKIDDTKKMLMTGVLKDDNQYHLNLTIQRFRSPTMANVLNVAPRGNLELPISQESKITLHARNSSLPSPDDLLNEHYACGHEAFSTIRSRLGLPPATPGEDPICSSCQKTHQPRQPRPKSTTRRAKETYHRFHIDTMFLSHTTTRREKYAQVIVDDASRKAWVQLMERKLRDLSKFRDLKRQLDNEKAPKRLAFLRGDGQYAVNSDWLEFYKQDGLYRESSAPYCQWQNGVAERTIGVLKRKSKPMEDFANTPGGDCGLALEWANYLRNNSTHSALLPGFTPQLRWEESKEPLPSPSPNTVKPIFGCLGYAKKYVFGKMDDQAIEVIFLGKSLHYKAWIVRELSTRRREFVTRDCIFDLNRFPYRARLETNHGFHTDPVLDDEPRVDDDDLAPRTDTRDADLKPLPAKNDPADGNRQNNEEELPTARDGEVAALPTIPTLSEPSGSEEHDPSSPIVGGLGGDGDGGDTSINSPPTIEDNEPRLRTSTQRMPSAKALENIINNNLYTIKGTGAMIKLTTVKPTACFAVSAVSGETSMINKPIPDPKTDKQAHESAHRRQWYEADCTEMAAMYEKGMWTLVPPDPNKRTFGTRFERKVKWDVKNPFVVDRFKSRLIAQGYGMILGLDFLKKFVTNVKTESIYFIFAIANHYDLNLCSLDMKNFFLEGENEHELLLRQPPGFQVEGKEDWVMQMHHTLYGTPQAPLEANKVLVVALQDTGLTRMKADAMVWFKRDKTGFVIVGWHVDDGQVAYSCEAALAPVEKVLRKHFTLKRTNESGDYCGLLISRDRPKRTMEIRQDNSVAEYIELTGMAHANPAKTPMPVSPSVLDRKKTPRLSYQRQKVFMSWVGKLIWLLKTRFEAAHAISTLATAMKEAHEADEQAAKHLARYFLFEPKTGIRIVATHHKDITFWMRTDTSFADRSKSRYSIGWTLHLGSPDDHGGVICAKSSRSHLAAQNTMEAESDGALQGSNVAVWSRSFFDELEFIQQDPTDIEVDNESVCIVADQDGEFHSRTKHWRLRMDILQERQLRKIHFIKSISTKNNSADMLTKPLPKAEFHRFKSINRAERDIDSD
jgi:hypothetical protein